MNKIKLDDGEIIDLDDHPLVYQDQDHPKNHYYDYGDGDLVIVISDDENKFMNIDEIEKKEVLKYFEDNYPDEMDSLRQEAFDKIVVEIERENDLEGYGKNFIYQDFSRDLVKMKKEILDTLKDRKEIFENDKKEFYLSQVRQVEKYKENENEI